MVMISDKMAEMKPANCVRNGVPVKKPSKSNIGCSLVFVKATNDARRGSTRAIALSGHERKRIIAATARLPIGHWTGTDQAAS